MAPGLGCIWLKLTLTAWASAWSQRASRNYFLGPAAFIIPFSGLLSSNISRGSCFSAESSPASVEHTSTKCFSEIFPGKWRVKKRLRQFLSLQNDSIYFLITLIYYQKRLKFIKTFVGHFNCLLNGAQDIKHPISLYSCGALNQMFWWWWQRNIFSFLFLKVKSFIWDQWMFWFTQCSCKCRANSINNVLWWWVIIDKYLGSVSPYTFTCSLTGSEASAELQVLRKYSTFYIKYQYILFIPDICNCWEFYGDSSLVLPEPSFVLLPPVSTQIEISLACLPAIASVENRTKIFV